jgi:hypothetical protein
VSRLPSQMHGARGGGVHEPRVMRVSCLRMLSMCENDGRADGLLCQQSVMSCRHASGMSSDS